jgi:hypothetical protein
MLFFAIFSPKILKFVCDFETTHLLSRHTCFRRRKAGGRNEG